MSDDLLRKRSSLTQTFKRKVNSAGQRLIHGLERAFRKWPEQFCLITGAPRSGTTAVEKWLNRQEKTVAFHESRMLIAVHRFIEEIYRHSSFKNDKKFLEMGRNMAYKFYSSRCKIVEYKLLIDKEPLEPIAFPDKNYRLFLKNYRLIFPEGKLIFMLREPLAAIWSMDERKWGHSLHNYTPHTFSLDTYIQTWCDSADLILEYADDKNSYICSFEKLVDNPKEESFKIFDFLQLKDGKIFQPRAVKNIKFDDEQRELIEEGTKDHMDKLRGRGLLNK